MMIAGMFVQLTAVMLYSFSELPIPAYIYLGVWILCAWLFFEVDVV